MLLSKRHVEPRRRVQVLVYVLKRFGFGRQGNAQHTAAPHIIEPAPGRYLAHNAPVHLEPLLARGAALLRTCFSVMFFYGMLLRRAPAESKRGHKDEEEERRSNE